MVFLVCIIVASLLYVECTFNLGVNYEVDISETPVKKQEVTQPAVYITSKSGQQFQCLLPQLTDEEITEKEASNEKDLDVLELLKPMKFKSCLSKSKDWWTYEFCFGHYIKQYHVEDGRISGQVLTLGVYDSDFDWNNETDQEKFKHAKQKYHSQYYTNGTRCDLTGKPRNAEVRFYCEEDAGDYIYRVDEPGTCSYVIIVYTSRVCSHPQLKPSPNSKAHSIPCHPVLNEEQYNKYLQKANEKKAIYEEKRNQWLAEQQERLQILKKKNVDASTGTNPSASKTPNVEPPVTTEEKFQEFLVQEAISAIKKMRTATKEQLPTVYKQLQQRFEHIFNEAKKDFDPEFIEENKEITLLKLTAISDTPVEISENDLLQAVKKILTKSDVFDSQASDTDRKTHKENIKDGKESRKAEADEESSSSGRIYSFKDDEKLQRLIKRVESKYSNDHSKQHEENSEQRKKLEQLVKERIEKLGIDTDGRRVEVKIISGGFFNENEEGTQFQTFSDEETTQFQNMIMSLVGGQQEAVHEEKRQKNLEKSYQFAWSENEEMEKKED